LTNKIHHKITSKITKNLSDFTCKQGLKNCPKLKLKSGCLRSFGRFKPARIFIKPRTLSLITGYKHFKKIIDKFADLRAIIILKEGTDKLKMRVYEGYLRKIFSEKYPEKKSNFRRIGREIGRRIE
jgi:hypothetical protein